MSGELVVKGERASSLPVCSTVRPRVRVLETKARQTLNLMSMGRWEGRGCAAWRIWAAQASKRWIRVWASEEVKLHTELGHWKNGGSCCLTISKTDSSWGSFVTSLVSGEVASEESPSSSLSFGV